MIDTIALDTRANFGGFFHSEQEHVIERFTRTSKNYLVQEDIVEDPVVLAKPWKSAPRKWSLSVVPDDDLEEFFCTTNEEPQEWQKEGRPRTSSRQLLPRVSKPKSSTRPGGRIAARRGASGKSGIRCGCETRLLFASAVSLEGCRARFSGVSRPAKHFVRHFGPELLQ